MDPNENTGDVQVEQTASLNVDPILAVNTVEGSPPTSGDIPSDESNQKLAMHAQSNEITLENRGPPMSQDIQGGVSAQPYENTEQGGMDPNYQYQQQGPNEAFLPEEDDIPLEGLSNKRIRCGFIVKVYMILLTQLAITAALCWVACVVDSYRDWMVHNSWIIWISLTVTLCVLYPLACYPSVARKVPLNYLLTQIFTLAESVTISWICAFYDPKHVVIAVSITLGMVLGLTVYACWSRSCDFTIQGGMLFAAVFSLMIMSFFLMWWNSYWVTILIATLGVIIFSAYLIYDTQLIIGGKTRQYQIDDYILAAINLYLDITRIFIYILAIVGR